MVSADYSCPDTVNSDQADDDSDGIDNACTLFEPDAKQYCKSRGLLGEDNVTGLKANQRVAVADVGGYSFMAGCDSFIA